MNYKFIVVENEKLSELETRLASGGDLDDYEIVNATWTGVATLFVLKEKTNE